MSLRNLLDGAALGAATMYFFDPASGQRRRRACEDQFRHLSHVVCDQWDMAVRDLHNRTAGLTSFILPRPDRDDSDEAIVDRVRSRLGHVVKHPKALEITARDGRITLKGPVLRNEERAATRCVAATPGVKDVEHRLEVHDSADIPALQNAHDPHGENHQCPLTPANRLMTLVGGLAAASYITRRPMLVLGTLAMALATSPIVKSQINEQKAVERSQAQSRRSKAAPRGRSTSKAVVEE